MKHLNIAVSLLLIMALASSCKEQKIDEKNTADIPGLYNPAFSFVRGFTFDGSDTEYKAVEYSWKDGLLVGIDNFDKDGVHYATQSFSHDEYGRFTERLYMPLDGGVPSRSEYSYTGNAMVILKYSPLSDDGQYIEGKTNVAGMTAFSYRDSLFYEASSADGADSTLNVNASDIIWDKGNIISFTLKKGEEVTHYSCTYDTSIKNYLKNGPSASPERIHFSFSDNMLTSYTTSDASGNKLCLYEIENVTDSEGRVTEQTFYRTDYTLEEPSRAAYAHSRNEYLQ